MGDLLSSPALWGAALALVGVIATVMATLRRDSATVAIEISKEARAEVCELRDEVGELRAEVKDWARKSRLLQEKYSVALTDSATVRIAANSARARVTALGVPTASLPPVPKLIREDMKHSWPEVFEGLAGEEPPPVV